MNYFMLIFGSIWAIIGTISLLAVRKRERLGYHTQGEVVDVVGGWASKSGMYYPIIRITTADGRVVERQIDVGTSIPLWSKGKKRSVVYFEDEIHLTGWGWMAVYGFFILAGVGIIAYQLINYYR